MPIALKKDSSRNNEEYYAYVPPDIDDIKDCVDNMVNAFSEYAKKCNLPEQEAIYDEHILAKIAERVDQRREYYRIYHRNTYLSEIRMVALQAYWIMKYHPFKEPTIDYGQYTLKMYVNQGMALHLILGIIAKIHYNGSSKNLFISTDYRERIWHALREHDLTKESVMMIAESLMQKVEQR